MGTVWVAQQLRLDRRVAIKVLRMGRTRDHARLENEARAIASVRHPSIVQVFDYGRTEGGDGYLAMELVDGPTLEARLDSVGGLGCEDAVTLVLPLLDGLAAVHDAGIIHRDIKPANILLAMEGSGASARVVPKLVDFGIAKSDGMASLTIEGDVIGTPAYMAPEQFAAAAIDERTDLWAVAATLHDMIAGEPPFVAPNLFELMRRVREEPPPFPRHAVGLDGKLWTVLTDALRKQPSERPQDALQLRARLADWLASRGGPRDLSHLVAPKPGSGAGARNLSAFPTGYADDLAVASVADAGASLSSFDALIHERLRKN
jgi:serine/threonine-protein kinase